MPLAKLKKEEITPEQISDLLYEYFSPVMKGFYEMQSSFFSTRYKIHKSIETSSIILTYVRQIHLAIVRKRERKLDHEVSLKNFISNLKLIESPRHKIVSIVNSTGIPKETVRRKIKKLIDLEYLSIDKNKEYYWNLTEKRESHFLKIANSDIYVIAKFVSDLAKYLNINLDKKAVEDEIKSEFSFYFYHYLTCQLKWLHMWQTKIKDIDLLFISMQALIPTLGYEEKSKNIKALGIDNIYKIVGKDHENKSLSHDSTINASSISEITGISRATCIRKIEKLVKLGLLIRDQKTKRYAVNNITAGRTKNIITKENVVFTISTFSEYLSIIINAMIRKKI